MGPNFLRGDDAFDAMLEQLVVEVVRCPRLDAVVEEVLAVLHREPSAPRGRTVAGPGASCSGGSTQLIEHCKRLANVVGRMPRALGAPSTQTPAVDTA